MRATKSEIRKIASELYELLSEEELDEIEREVSKKRFSFRDFGILITNLERGEWDEILFRSRGREIVDKVEE